MEQPKSVSEPISKIADAFVAEAKWFDVKNLWDSVLRPDENGSRYLLILITSLIIGLNTGIVEIISMNVAGQGIKITLENLSIPLCVVGLILAIDNYFSYRRSSELLKIGLEHAQLATTHLEQALEIEYANRDSETDQDTGSIALEEITELRVIDILARTAARLNAANKLKPSQLEVKEQLTQVIEKILTDARSVDPWLVIELHSYFNDRTKNKIIVYLVESIEKVGLSAVEKQLGEKSTRIYQNLNKKSIDELKSQVTIWPDDLQIAHQAISNVHVIERLKLVAKQVRRLLASSKFDYAFRFWAPTSLYLLAVVQTIFVTASLRIG